MPLFLQHAPPATSAASFLQAKCTTCEAEQQHQEEEDAPLPEARVQASCDCGAAPPDDHDERVMMKADGGGMDPGHTHAIAQDGVRSASAPLPHRDLIQASFGRHDVTGVRAQIGGSAEHPSARIGALAYTVGHRIAFRRAPDVKLAAHEAAHVVQQRSGVKLHDGVGRPGDAYERQADEVAEAVARGESAEPILDRGGALLDRELTHVAQQRIAGTTVIQRQPVPPSEEATEPDVVPTFTLGPAELTVGMGERVAISATMTGLTNSSDLGVASLNKSEDIHTVQDFDIESLYRERSFTIYASQSGTLSATFDYHGVPITSNPVHVTVTPPTFTLEPETPDPVAKGDRIHFTSNIAGIHDLAELGSTTVAASPGLEIEPASLDVATLQPTGTFDLIVKSTGTLQVIFDYFGTDFESNEVAVSMIEPSVRLDFPGDPYQLEIGKEFEINAQVEGIGDVSQLGAGAMNVDSEGIEPVEIPDVSQLIPSGQIIASLTSYEVAWMAVSFEYMEETIQSAPVVIRGPDLMSYDPVTGILKITIPHGATAKQLYDLNRQLYNHFDFRDMVDWKFDLIHGEPVPPPACDVECQQSYYDALMSGGTKEPLESKPAEPEPEPDVLPPVDLPKGRPANNNDPRDLKCASRARAAYDMCISQNRPQAICERARGIVWSNCMRGL